MPGRKLIGPPSREHSQTALNYIPAANSVDGITRINPSLDLEAAASALSKFSLDCQYYRRAKTELLKSGWNEVSVFGRAEIDVDTILLGFSDPADTHLVPSWCSRTVNKILPGASLPVRLASTWVLTKMTRVSVAATTSKID